MKCARKIFLTASVRSRSFKLGIYFNLKSKICTNFAGGKPTAITFFACINKKIADDLHACLYDKQINL